MAHCNMLIMQHGLNSEQLAQELRAINIPQHEIPRLLNGLELVKQETRANHKELLASHPVARKVKSETAENYD